MKTRDETIEKGRITRGYTFWCGQCPEWERIECLFVDNLRDAILEAERHGWTKSSVFGWICPGCSGGRYSKGPGKSKSLTFGYRSTEDADENP